MPASARNLDRRRRQAPGWRAAGLRRYGPSRRSGCPDRSSLRSGCRARGCRRRRAPGRFVRNFSTGTRRLTGNRRSRIPPTRRGVPGRWWIGSSPHRCGLAGLSGRRWRPGRGAKDRQPALIFLCVAMTGCLQQMANPRNINRPCLGRTCFRTAAIRLRRSALLFLRFLVRCHRCHPRPGTGNVVTACPRCNLSYRQDRTELIGFVALAPNRRGSTSICGTKYDHRQPAWLPALPAPGFPWPPSPIH